jgi:hypothetical protein
MAKFTASGLRIGDTVTVRMHPAGPGTEEYRLRHGTPIDVKITKITKLGELHGEFTISGVYHIRNLDCLLEWLTLMDGVNSGEQIGDTPVLEDVEGDCVEAIVFRSPLRGLEDALTQFQHAAAGLDAAWSMVDGDGTEIENYPEGWESFDEVALRIDSMQVR